MSLMEINCVKTFEISCISQNQGINIKNGQIFYLEVLFIFLLYLLYLSDLVGPLTAQL